jgi:hypothetical protein
MSRIFSAMTFIVSVSAFAGPFTEREQISSDRYLINVNYNTTDPGTAFCDEGDELTAGGCGFGYSEDPKESFLPILLSKPQLEYNYVNNKKVGVSREGWICAFPTGIVKKASFEVTASCRKKK